jgi:hypothetical protein
VEVGVVEEHPSELFRQRYQAVQCVFAHYLLLVL